MVSFAGRRRRDLSFSNGTDFTAMEDFVSTPDDVAAGVALLFLRLWYQSTRDTDGVFVVEADVKKSNSVKTLQKTGEEGKSPLERFEMFQMEEKSPLERFKTFQKVQSMEEHSETFQEEGQSLQERSKKFRRGQPPLQRFRKPQKERQAPLRRFETSQNEDQTPLKRFKTFQKKGTETPKKLRTLRENGSVRNQSEKFRTREVRIRYRRGVKVSH